VVARALVVPVVERAFALQHLRRALGVLRSRASHENQSDRQRHNPYRGWNLTKKFAFHDVLPPRHDFRLASMGASSNRFFASRHLNSSKKRIPAAWAATAPSLLQDRAVHDG
jgi:hypothetical protein